MLLREIFSDVEEPQAAQSNEGLSIFLENKSQKFSIQRSLWLSTMMHILLFALVFAIAKVLVYILMFFGIDLGLFQRPALKIRDIEFVFVFAYASAVRKVEIRVCQIS